MKKYCRYCGWCFQADEDEFRCSNHPQGLQPHWTRAQINRPTNCPHFALSDLGDAETGKMYRPRAGRAVRGKDGVRYEQIRMVIKETE